MAFAISSEQQITDFISRHRDLLGKERDAEIERTSLLLTNCAPSLLEQKGLALGSLGLNLLGIFAGSCAIYILTECTARWSMEVGDSAEITPC